MSTSNVPEVLPVVRARPARRPGRSFGRRVGAFVSFVVGWSWRLLVGAVMCFNFFVLSFVTSVAVVGWTYRWMQGRVLRRWWKQSRWRQEGSFEEFCKTLGHDAPVARPRWFVQERPGMVFARPGSVVRQFFRALRVPWHALWLNFKVGVQGLVCTYLLTGWGCLLMLLSWEFGWLNSFHKGYEQSVIGPLTGLLGSLLFLLAMFYVPMAQAHQAAAGQARAFFEFRFVWRLIRARLTAYVGLAALIGFAGLVLNVVLLVPVGQDFVGNAEATAAEGLEAYRLYLFWCSLLLLFPLWLLLHGVAARVYGSAVLKVLRTGAVTRAELHPTLARWLDRLGLDVTPRASIPGLGWYARLTARFAYRRVLFTLLFLLWVAFVVRFYVGYFFRADPFVAFMNHPMVQLPCFDAIPPHLYAGDNE